MTARAEFQGWAGLETRWYRYRNTATGVVYEPAARVQRGTSESESRALALASLVAEHPGTYVLVTGS